MLVLLIIVYLWNNDLLSSHTSVCFYVYFVLY